MQTRLLNSQPTEGWESRCTFPKRILLLHLCGNNQSVNQPANQPTNHPINQSGGHPYHGIGATQAPHTKNSANVQTASFRCCRSGAGLYLQIGAEMKHDHATRERSVHDCCGHERLPEFDFRPSRRCLRTMLRYFSIPQREFSGCETLC